jgi:hypothetical protein
MTSLYPKSKLATHNLILRVIGATKGLAQAVNLITGANNEGRAGVGDGRLACCLILKDDGLWLAIGGSHRESEKELSPSSQWPSNQCLAVDQCLAPVHSPPVQLIE